jgi:hypothetical protein
VRLDDTQSFDTIRRSPMTSLVGAVYPPEQSRHTHSLDLSSLLSQSHTIRGENKSNLWWIVPPRLGKSHLYFFKILPFIAPFSPSFRVEGAKPWYLVLRITLRAHTQQQATHRIVVLFILFIIALSIRTQATAAARPVLLLMYVTGRTSV